MTDYIQLYTSNDLNSPLTTKYMYSLDSYGSEIQMAAMQNLGMGFDPHYLLFLVGPNNEFQKIKSKYTLRSLGATNDMALYVLLTDPKPNTTLRVNSPPLINQDLLPRLNSSQASKPPHPNPISKPLTKQSPNIRSSSNVSSLKNSLLKNNPYSKERNFGSSLQHPPKLSILANKSVHPRSQSTNGQPLFPSLQNKQNHLSLEQNEQPKSSDETKIHSNSSLNQLIESSRLLIPPEIEPYVYSLDDFIITKTRQSISYAESKSTGLKYVIKHLNGKFQTDHFCKDFTTLLGAEAGCINHAEGITLDPYSIIYKYETNGSLEDILDAENIMNAPKEWNATAKLIALFGIAEGMRELHSKRIMHRNLKPSNVIMDQQFFPCISDVGFIREYNRNPSYMAPELLSGGAYKSKIDVFAYGMIVYQTLAQQPPFSPSISFQKVKEMILEGKRPDIPNDMPSNYAHLIQQCWNQEASSRPTFAVIVEGFVNGNYNLPGADLNLFLDYQHLVAPQYDPENATIRLLQKQAEYGDSDALFTFAASLLRGRGVVKNFKEGIKYLKQSAKKGNPEAQFHYARYLLRFEKETDEAKKYLLASANKYLPAQQLLNTLDKPVEITEQPKEEEPAEVNNSILPQPHQEVPPMPTAESIFEEALSLEKQNPQHAFSLFKESADMGLAKAQLHVALILHNGSKGIEQNLTEANKYYKLAADQGNSHAMCNLAYNLQRGNGIDKDLVMANELFKKSSENGYTGAQFNYACNLMNGIGVEKDLEKANFYLKQASDNHHPGAQYSYAVNLMKGNGVPKDVTLANKYLKMSADKGNDMAECQYAMNLSASNGIEKDLIEANKYYRSSADKGNARAQCNFAFALQKGVGIQPDVALANHYYKLSADQGNAISQYNYAFNLENGNGIDKNIPEANKYFKMAADQGNVPAQYNYGMNLTKGLGIDQNIVEANKYLKLAAEQNNQRAQYQYALHLQKGNGCQKDTKLANEYLKKSADQGNPNAQFYYGYNLFNGNGIPKDTEEANRYYKLAADQGNSNSQCNLACSYLNGMGLPKNIELANKYYKMAADSGNAVAQYNYGIHLMNGNGLQKDPKAAIEYLQKSAAAGNSSAQYCISLCYENGTCLPKNPELAAKYLKMSAAAGNKLALQRIKK